MCYHENYTCEKARNHRWESYVICEVFQKHIGNKCDNMWWIFLFFTCEMHVLSLIRVIYEKRKRNIGDIKRTSRGTGASLGCSFSPLFPQCIFPPILCSLHPLCSVNSIFPLSWCQFVLRFHWGWQREQRHDPLEGTEPPNPNIALLTEQSLVGYRPRELWLTGPPSGLSSGDEREAPGWMWQGEVIHYPFPRNPPLFFLSPSPPPPF